MKLSISLFAALLVFGLVSSASGAMDPCARPTRVLSTTSQATQTAVDALNANFNVVAGTAHNVASCTLKSNPNVTACLTVASAHDRNGTWLVFEIYDQTAQYWSNGVFISSNDDSSHFSDSAALMTVSNKRWSDGSWHGGSEGGNRHSVSFNKITQTLRYKAWDGNPAGPLGLFHKWTLKQNEKFTCELR